MVLVVRWLKFYNEEVHKLLVLSFQKIAGYLKPKHTLQNHVSMCNVYWQNCTSARAIILIILTKNEWPNIYFISEMITVIVTLGYMH